MSSEEPTVTVNMKSLEQLIKAFSGDMPVLRIGILADSSHGGKEGSTNVEIGAAHEYGAPARKLPMRSFLRMPLNTKLGERMEEAGLFKEETIKGFIKTGSVETFMKLTGEIALNVVREAFDTGGFGKWAKWKDPNYNNNAGQILVDSAQLRDSIAYEVK